jgi:hypothetical protein
MGALSVAIIATFAVLFLTFGVGRFAALDCVPDLESRKCLFWMKFTLSAWAVLIAVWTAVIGLIIGRPWIFWIAAAVLVVAGAALLLSA